MVDGEDMFQFLEPGRLIAFCTGCDGNKHETTPVYLSLRKRNVVRRGKCLICKTVFVSMSVEGE